MQAVKAYYNQGRFVPVGLHNWAEGTPAIITVIDEATPNAEEKLKAFDALVAEIHAAADEEMPLLEPLQFREVEL